jgi:hypothetical protein
MKTHTVTSTSSTLVRLALKNLINELYFHEYHTLSKTLAVIMFDVLNEVCLTGKHSGISKTLWNVYCVFM